ncbi:sulfate/molybdate ABC transporter ATP-binding protein [Roseateles depolymerans]|uniref:Sulfate ABC transporter ATP-binding protein n=1 Tax=Roseateles depolymerans TaxID=76731 RepID=A0A0U3CTD0_9BURK|nr:sulfate ABC transporter ATP-binding protein [Roseateles depolymerans]ALV04582.1 sulfate ABC transporter ATP-binding protein [Roseateles depolymerans]REG14114.1 sulfate transport system ATP-binding protein [Roseateles depolymerans]
MSIQVRNIHKSFGSFTALGDVSLDFPTGELTALLGPSGCGKTTLLRIIAGLETADLGQVLLDGQDASDTHVREREVGFVFQHYALFRHMTVFDNVAFGLRVKPRKQRPPEAEIKRKVHELLQLVQLDWLADRYPPQLSGGQRQRIALARALAVEPRVLLLDEPFGALDAKVRKELRRWLRRLHDELHITSIFVTHDQEEALEVADRVVLMDHGRVEQVGAPAEVYERPATPFVYGFLGAVNRFEGRSEGGRLHVGDQVLAQDLASAAQDPQGLVQAYARPHELVIIPQVDAPGLPATVERVLSFGAAARVELRGPKGEHLEAELSREQAQALSLSSGQQVRLQASRLSVFGLTQAA